jgi:hypothetical protein
MIQKQSTPKRATTLKATRALCISEGFWNLFLGMYQVAMLAILPRLYLSLLPNYLAWMTWPTVVVVGMLTLYRIALAGRWFWRVQYLSQPIFVEPTHWQDKKQSFSVSRLILATVCAVIATLIFLPLLLVRPLPPLLLTAIIALLCLILSVIAGWLHFKQTRSN